MRPAGGRFRFDTALDLWMAMKAQFRAATGISFSGSLGCLYQNYSDPLNGVQDAEGFKLTFNLSKDIINAGTPDAMTPDIAVEQRGPVGTPLPPLQGGIAAGNMVPTAATRGGVRSGDQPALHPSKPVWKPVPIRHRQGICAELCRCLSVLR